MSALPARVTFPAPNFDVLLVIVLRRWRVILGITLALGIGALLALPFLTTSYQVSARVLVKLGREQSAPVVAGGTTQAAMPRRTEDVTSEIEILKSQSLLESLVEHFGVEYFTARKEPVTFFEHVKAFARSVVRTVREAFEELLILVGLEKRLTPFEKVVATLQASVSAEAVKRADVIDVTLLATDREAGGTVLAKLLELYQAEHIRVFRTPGATEFLRDRVDTLKQNLQEIEAQRRAFGAKGEVWDYDEQRKMLLQRQNELRGGLARSEQELSRLRNEIEQAQASLRAPARDTVTQRVEQVNPAAQALQLRIVERRAGLARLSGTYADDSQRLQDERAEIARLEDLLGRTERSFTQSQTYETSLPRRDLERSLTEKENRLSGARAQLARQLEDLREVEKSQDRLDGLGAESRRLQREAALSEQSYQLYARRLDEARISEALDAASISNVAIIGRPTAGIKPVRPRAMLIFLGALAAGLFGSIGWFLLRDVLRPVVHSREKALEVLGVPVLARLPEVR